MRALTCVLGLSVGVMFWILQTPRTAQGDMFIPVGRVDRPVEILPEKKVVQIIANLPPVSDPWLRDVLDSPDTMFYDHSTIIPGYQDSFGDGYFPVGFRPNTIDPGLINLAVPGGHSKLFIRSGEFHFPFGRTGKPDDAKNTFVVDFWRLPREGGKILPVVHWRKEPNNNTHRIEWMFPQGTVFGEMIFLTDSSNQSHIFEIRTRMRTLTGWTMDVFRPFVTADDLVRALEDKKAQNPAWGSSASVQTLVSYLRDANSLRAATLSNTNFSGSFASVSGATDTLPAVDEALVVELLRETEFRSAKGKVWKQNGSLTAYAPSTQAPFHIVPKNNNAALFETSDAFCTRCHENAGRPFKDYYPQVMAYGELWGEDDVISWHPFEAKNFVDSKGKVVSFNDDNRVFRKDFIQGGVLAPYNPSVHTAARYQKIQHAWKKYTY